MNCAGSGGEKGTGLWKFLHERRLVRRVEEVIAGIVVDLQVGYVYIVPGPVVRDPGSRREILMMIFVH